MSDENNGGCHLIICRILGWKKREESVCSICSDDAYELYEISVWVGPTKVSGEPSGSGKADGILGWH